MPRKKIEKKLPKHVHVKKGVWYVGLNFPAGRDAAGKIIYEQIARRCVPESEIRAVALVGDIINERNRALALGPQNPKQSIARFLTAYLSAKQSAIAHRTHDFYTGQFARYVKDSPFGASEVSAVRPLHIQAFYLELQKKGASSDAIRKLHQFLSAAFNQAVRWETLLKNPATGVILPKKVKSSVAALTASEACRLLEVCRATVSNIVFEFALETAMRPQEYLALSWSDIDFKARSATVARAVAIGFVGGGFEIKSTKTAGSERTIVFSEQLAARLAIHRAAQEKIIESLKRKIKPDAKLKTNKKETTRAIRGKIAQATAKRVLNDYRKYDLVFPSANGKPQSRLNLNRREFKAVLKSAELDAGKFSLYSLRRTAATLLAAHINPKELSAFLGHSDVTTTMKYYVMITEDSKYKASDALVGIFY